MLIIHALVKEVYRAGVEFFRAGAVSLAVFITFNLYREFPTV